jgi:hypothetical protein
MLKSRGQDRPVQAGLAAACAKQIDGMPSMATAATRVTRMALRGLFMIHP